MIFFFSGYYQAIVLDPNPKAVCQLLALAVEHIDTLLEDWYPSLGTRFLHTSEGKMLVTRLVPCPRCLTTHNERESTKSWQDWSFLSKKQKPSQQQAQQQQQPRPAELLRVSQDSGMGQESPRESQNAPEEASEAVETEDEHLPSSYKLVWVLNNINSSLSLLITIGGDKNVVKKLPNVIFLFQFIGVCCITVRDTLLTMRTSLDMDSSLWFV